MENYLYKYTTLETLALILKSKKIRLNPLNKMDDLQEARTKDSIDFSRFVFISSWMNQAKESIAMWKLYSNMFNGVRIGLKRNPFKKYTIFANEIKRELLVDEVIGETNDFILPLEECFGDNFMIQNYMYKNVLNKVVYSDREEDLFPNILKISKEGLELAYGKLGLYKNTYWEFQNEERYILRYFPFSVNKMVLLKDKCASYAFDALDKKINFFKYKDLEIDNEAFFNMKITTAPNFTEGNMVILNALKDLFNPCMIIEKSELSNSIAT